MNSYHKDGCIDPDWHNPEGNIKGRCRKNIAPRAITKIDCKGFRTRSTDSTE